MMLEGHIEGILLEEGAPIVPDGFGDFLFIFIYRRIGRYMVGGKL
jgi:hypothetical protein